MLRFEFKQDTEFSNPYYNIMSGMPYYGYIGFYDGKWSATLYMGERFDSTKLREIADKVDELNTSLGRFKW